jgi:hypothetical protein
MRKYERFDTELAMIQHLTRNGYTQDDDGVWRRDSWTVYIDRLKNGTFRVSNG